MPSDRTTASKKVELTAFRPGDELDAILTKLAAELTDGNQSAYIRGAIFIDAARRGLPVDTNKYGLVPQFAIPEIQRLQAVQRSMETDREVQNSGNRTGETK